MDKKIPLYKSLGCAFRGLWFALRTERNLKIHTAALFIAVGVGIYLGLSEVEWGLIIFAIGFVFTGELFNTALEKWCDEASGNKQSEIIRNAKDISAAAALITAITAVIIGIMVLIIPLFQKIF